MISRESKTRRELVFVEEGLDGLTKAALKLVENGSRRLHFRPFNEWARHIAESILARRLKAQFFVPQETCGVIPGPFERSIPQEGDTVVVALSRGEELSAELIRYLNWKGTLLAPVTEQHFSKRPLFVISIPKAGTHLLYKLVHAFGYHEGIVLNANAFPRPGHWYCVEYSNSHTSARDFFVDTVRRSPFGNRNHPFMRSPAVMIYRNPLDILVSEANYYHKDGKTSFYGYLANLSFEERVSRLMNDPWLHGSIRDRVGGFIPWLEMPNVIPVSFEELAGPKGGGNAEIQHDLIWSIQLKLHVPGSPDEFSERVFDPDSPTFFAGRVGAYREKLAPEAFEKFQQLDQDFMVAFGYDGSDMSACVAPPKRAAEFRRRALVVSGQDFEMTPITVEHDFLGCNLVRYRHRFYAMPLTTGPIDFRTIPDGVLDSLPQATTVSDLKQVLALGSLYVHRLRHWIESDLSGLVTGQGNGPKSERERAGVQFQLTRHIRGETDTPTIVETYRCFNIVSFRFGFYGLRNTVGAVNFSLGDKALTGRYKPEDFVLSDSLQDVKNRIDYIELARDLRERLIDIDKQLRELNGRIAHMKNGIGVPRSSWWSRGLTRLRLTGLVRRPCNDTGPPPWPNRGCD